MYYRSHRKTMACSIAGTLIQRTLLLTKRSFSCRRAQISEEGNFVSFGRPGILLRKYMKSETFWDFLDKNQYFSWPSSKNYLCFHPTLSFWYVIKCHHSFSCHYYFVLLEFHTLILKFLGSDFSEYHQQPPYSFELQRSHVLHQVQGFCLMVILENKL